MSYFLRLLDPPAPTPPRFEPRQVAEAETPLEIEEFRAIDPPPPAPPEHPAEAGPAATPVEPTASRDAPRRSPSGGIRPIEPPQADPDDEAIRPEVLLHSTDGRAGRGRMSFPVTPPAESPRPAADERPRPQGSPIRDAARVPATEGPTPAPPRDWRGALAEVRRWVAATPEPGEPSPVLRAEPPPPDSPRPTASEPRALPVPIQKEDTGRLAPRAAGPDPEPGTSVALRQFDLHIGTIQVVVEGPPEPAAPLAPSASPHPPPPRAAPDNAALRLRRHYLRF